MKETPADLAFSWCVRERANWTCETCGTRHDPPTRALQCSHYFGRDYWGTRFDPRNALCQCTHCHFRVKIDPDWFREEFKKIADRQGIDIDELRKVAYDSGGIAKEYKRTKGKGEIAAHYRNEYECMVLLRNAGETGRIEFQAWI